MMLYRHKEKEKGKGGEKQKQINATMHLELWSGK